MASYVQRDWGTFAVGVVLLVLALLIGAFPSFTLATVTTIVGIGLVVIGAMALVNYFRAGPIAIAFSWTLVYALFAIVFGIMLMVRPLMFSSFMVFLIGFLALALGIFTIVAAVNARSAGTGDWALQLVMGIIDALCGIMLFVAPAMIVVILAIFLGIHGVSLMVEGWNNEVHGGRGTGGFGGGSGGNYGGGSGGSGKKPPSARRV